MALELVTVNIPSSEKSSNCLFALTECYGIKEDNVTELGLVCEWLCHNFVDEIGFEYI